MTDHPRPYLTVEEMLRLCASLAVPFPRHILAPNGRVVTWVDAREFVELLHRLAAQRTA